MVNPLLSILRPKAAQYSICPAVERRNVCADALAAVTKAAGNLTDKWLGATGGANKCFEHDSSSIVTMVGFYLKSQYGAKRVNLDLKELILDNLVIAEHRWS